jgi:hypothetical protein
LLDNSEKSLSRFSSFNADKFLFLLGSLFVILAVVSIIIAGPARGYEISIYTSYPTFFWLFIIGGFICGLIILINQSFSRKKSYWWIFGLLIVVSIDLIVLLLPVLRGYASWLGTDSMIQLGYSKDILFTGHLTAPGFKGENFYPGIHLLAVALFYATGIKLELLIMILPSIFSLFYIISIFVLSKILTHSLNKAILMTTFGSLLLFTTYQDCFIPSFLAFLLVPFVLFVYFKLNSVGVKFWMPLVLVLCVIPVYHPGEVPLFLLLIFTVIYLGSEFSRYLNRKGNQTFENVSKRNFMRIIFPIAILSGSLVIWFSPFLAFKSNILQIVNWVYGESGQSSVAYALGSLSRANLSPLQFTDLFMKMYGHILVYFLLSLALSIIILRKVFISHEKIIDYKLVFCFLFLFFGLGIFIFAFNQFVISYDRELRWVIFASTMLNGICLIDLYSKSKRKNMRSMIKSVAVIVLLVAMIFSLFNTFASPITRSYNFQVTATDMGGMSWFFKHQDGVTPVTDIEVASFKYAYAIMGIANSPGSIGVAGLSQSIRVIDLPPPDHFGYSNYTTLGQSYVGDRYLIENKLSRIIYPEIAPNQELQWRFTPSDFAKLQNDISVNSIYSNGALSVYRVHGSEK